MRSPLRLGTALYWTAQHIQVVLRLLLLWSRARAKVRSKHELLRLHLKLPWNFL